MFEFQTDIPGIALFLESRMSPASLPDPDPGNVSLPAHLSVAQHPSHQAVECLDNIQFPKIADIQ